MVQFQINGRSVDANDVRVLVPTEDGHTIVAILGSDGFISYAVNDEDGSVLDLRSFDYGSLIDHFHDLQN